MDVKLEISTGLAYNIISEVQQDWKVSESGCQKTDTPFSLRERREDVCENPIQRYEAEGDVFPQDIVTGNEFWVH